MTDRIIKILIIVTVAMPFFLFASSLFAQDNYTVVVKAINQIAGGQMTRMYSTGTQSYSTKQFTGVYVNNQLKSTGWKTISLTTGTYSSTTPPPGFYTAFWGSRENYSLSTSFNAAANISVGMKTTRTSTVANNLTYKVTRWSQPKTESWGYSSVYTATTFYRAYINFPLTRIPACGTVSEVEFELYGQHYQYSMGYLPQIPGGVSQSDWNLLSNTNYGSYSINTYGRYAYTLNNAAKNQMNDNLRNGVTSYGIAFRREITPSTLTYYAPWTNNNASSLGYDPSMAIAYSAPWSCAITPSASPNTSSVCANDGVFTLTASQSVNTNYVSITPTSWAWYSATASNGAYSPIGSTNASTFAVTAPSNTGAIWYKYNQSINMMSNNTLETKASSYSITFCNPGSIYVSQCCTSLGSSPSFSATQVRDRSVNLQWSGMDHVDHFVIRYGVDGGVSFKEVTVAGNATSKLIERLTNGRSYFFQIQAIGASGYCDTQLSTKIYLTPNCQ